MKRIGLLSDTHGFVHPKILDYFKDVDEIWHAGDMGSLEVAQQLSQVKPFKGVYGNIDGQEIRAYYKKHLRFNCEEVDVWLTHIGGYPNKYDASIKQALLENPPTLFICGHSHILKVMYDKKLACLHMNPGAAGKYGFHQVITVLKFTIEGKEIKALEVLELPKGDIVQDKK